MSRKPGVACRTAQASSNKTYRPHLYSWERLRLRRDSIQDLLSILSDDERLLDPQDVRVGLDHRDDRSAAGLRLDADDPPHQDVGRVDAAQPGGDDLIPHRGHRLAGEVGKDALAPGGVGRVPGDDAVVPGAGDHPRRVEAGVQDGQHPAAGQAGLDDGAQELALVVDDGVAPLHPVDGALVQGKAPEGVHAVPPDDKGGDKAHLGVVLLDAGQVAEGLVLGFQLVVVRQLAAQLGVFFPQGLVFRHGLVDAGVLVPHRGHPAGHPGRRLLERGHGHAQQLLRGCGQASVGRGIQQQPGKKDRYRDQNPEFPGLKKVLHGRSPPLGEKHRVEKARTAGAIRASVIKYAVRAGICTAPLPSAFSGAAAPDGGAALHMVPVGVQHVVQHIHMVQHGAGAGGHAVQRVLGHMDVDAGLALDQLIQAAQQSAAAGQGDAAVDDVGAQFGRGALQRLLDGVGDLDQALQQGLAHVLRVDHDVLGQAVHQVAALDLHGHLFFQLVGRTDVDLDLFGGALADQEVILALDEGDDGLVEHIAGHADAAGRHDAAQRDDGDLGGAAADVHDHAAGGLADGQARADGGGHGLLDHRHLAGAGLEGRLTDGPALHLGDARGDADDHPGPGEQAVAAGFFQKVLQHIGGDVKIGDDAVLQGTDRHDAARGAADDGLGLRADAADFIVAGVHRHHRRLPHDDALALHVHQGVGGTQVDPDIL